jgi:hypothetical protein
MRSSDLSRAKHHVPRSRCTTGQKVQQLPLFLLSVSSSVYWHKGCFKIIKSDVAEAAEILAKDIDLAESSLVPQYHFRDQTAPD